MHNYKSAVLLATVSLHISDSTHWTRSTERAHPYRFTHQLSFC